MSLRILANPQSEFDEQNAGWDQRRFAALAHHCQTRRPIPLKSDTQPDLSITPMNDVIWTFRPNHL